MRWPLVVLLCCDSAYARPVCQDAGATGQAKAMAADLNTLKDQLVASHFPKVMNCDPFGSPVGLRTQVGLHDSELPLHWNEYLPGSDLVVEELKGRKGLREVRMGLIDMGADPGGIDPKRLVPQPTILPSSAPDVSAQLRFHGRFVAQAMARNSSPKAKFALISEVVAPADFARAAKALESHPVDIVNMSISLHDDGLLEPTKAIAQRAVTVVSAGNFGERPMEKAKTDSGAIVVGSLSTNGLVNAYSQESPAVAVVAPSGEIMATGEVESQKESATSGAAPQVAAALANAMAVLGPLTNAQARTLIEKTAQTAPNSRDPEKKNGAGLLNSYKLLKAAERLRARGWPRDAERLLQEPGIFDFAAEGEARLREGLALLFKPDCRSRIEGLKRVRKSYLLTGNEPARVLLVNAMWDADYGKMARIYGNLVSSRQARDSDWLTIKESAK